MDILQDIERIIVETDEENPTTVVVITDEEISAINGYRVRLKPKELTLSELAEPLVNYLLRNYDLMCEIRITPERVEVLRSERTEIIESEY